MKPYPFFGLAAVTALVVIAAGVAVATRPSPSVIAHGDTYAFPGLGETLEAVAAITVKHGESAFTLRRADDDGAWVMTDKYDYPVPLEKVRKLVLGLADLRLFETKTKRPDRYARLEVEDIEAEGARSRMVTLKDAAGEELVRTIIGKRKNNLFGFRRDGTYLRAPGAEQAWLAEGAVRVETDPMRWLEQEIISIRMGDVREMVIRQPDGEELRVTKSARDTPDFAVDEVPEGTALDQSEVNFLATGLAFLEMQDVKPGGEIAFPEAPHRATYTSFDGVIVSAEIVEKDGKFWGRFTVDHDAEAAAPPAERTDEGPEPPPAKSAADVAREIAARVEGWVFEIPDYKAEKLTARLDDVVQQGTDEPS